MQEILNPNEDDVILRAHPATEIHREVIYCPVSDQVPFYDDPTWGMYDGDGNIIKSAAHRRGYDNQMLGQSEHRDISELKLQRAPPGRYMYGGLMYDHFGHFLLSTFSRFWLGRPYSLKSPYPHPPSWSTTSLTGRLPNGAIAPAIG